MTDLLKNPITELNRKLARKEISAVELMQATLARIDETHEALNAFVNLRDHCRKATSLASTNDTKSFVQARCDRIWRLRCLRPFFPAATATASSRCRL